MILIIIGILFLLAVLVFAIYEKERYNNLNQQLRQRYKKYIRVDVRLWNAVYEAREQARKENRTLDYKNFNELLTELKGRM